MDDRNEKDLLPIDVYEIVMRSVDDWRHVFGFHRLLSCFEKIIADGATYDTLPVFLQEQIANIVYQEQAVNHDEAGKPTSYKTEI